MKKLLLFITLMMVSALVLNAQLEAGKVLIGTSTTLSGSSLLADCPNTAGFSVISSKYKTDEYESDASQITTFNLTPRVGFLVTDAVLAGAQVNIESYKEEDSDAVTTFSFGPFARYYFDLSNFKPFVQAGMNIGQVNYGDGYKMNLFNYGGGIGGAFFFSDHVSFDLLLNYTHAYMKDKDSSDNARDLMDTFGFGFGLSIFL